MARGRRGRSLARCAPRLRSLRCARSSAPPSPAPARITFGVWAPASYGVMRRSRGPRGRWNAISATKGLFALSRVSTVANWLVARSISIRGAQRFRRGRRRGLSDGAVEGRVCAGDGVRGASDAASNGTTEPSRRFVTEARCHRRRTTRRGARGSIVEVTVMVIGSTCRTVPSMSSTTRTPPSITARPDPPVRWWPRRGQAVPASIRRSSRLVRSTTQIEP